MSHPLSSMSYTTVLSKKCQNLFPTPTRLKLDLWTLVIVGVHKVYEFKASSQWCQVHNLETPDWVQSSHFTEGNPKPRKIEWIIQGHNAHYSKNGGAAIACSLPSSPNGEQFSFCFLLGGLRSLLSWDFNSILSALLTWQHGFPHCPSSCQWRIPGALCSRLLTDNVPASLEGTEVINNKDDCRKVRGKNACQVPLCASGQMAV